MAPHRNRLVAHSKLHPLKRHQQLSTFHFDRSVEFGLTTDLRPHWVVQLAVNPIVRSAEQFVAQQNYLIAQSAVYHVQHDHSAKLEAAQWPE